jgi:hypothetical protein
MNSLKALTTLYYDQMHQAIKTGHFDFDKIPFDEKISIIGPNERFDGAEAVKNMYPFFIQLLKGFRIRDSFFSEASACFIVEFFPINGGDPILTAEWFHFNKGKIATITPIYDTEAWKNVVSK